MTFTTESLSSLLDTGKGPCGQPGNVREGSHIGGSRAKTRTEVGSVLQILRHLPIQRGTLDWSAVRERIPWRQMNLSKELSAVMLRVG